MKRKIGRMMILFALAVAVASPMLGQSHSNSKKNNGIRYHNGEVMLGTVHIYFIFYGNWAGSNVPDALTEFVLNLGRSAYHNINTTYFDGTGARISNSMMLGRSIEVSYSRGTDLSEEDVEAVVSSSISNGQLPLDPNGLFFVIASPDVNATGLCTDRCEFHDSLFLSGVTVKYAFVGNPERCPGKCASQFFDRKGKQIRTPPSDGADYRTDAIISWVAHAISGAMTSPSLDGWFDTRGQENSDKCVNKFGHTYITATGGHANVRLGQRDYLLQQNWVNADGGYCSLAYP